MIPDQKSSEIVDFKGFFFCLIIGLDPTEASYFRGSPLLAALPFY